MRDKCNSLRSRSDSSKNSQQALMYTTFLSMLWLLVFGSAMMSKRESSASFSEDAVSNLSNLEEEGSEEKLTFFSVVIHPQPSPSFFSTFIKLPQEASTLQEKALQPQVLQYMLPKTQRPKKSFSKVEPWSSQIEASAVLMSLIKWTITPESSSMKQWSNKLYLSLKQESSAP